MKTDTADRLEAREHLRRALGDPRAEFRSGQWEAIDRLVNRRERLLVVERTGWGKSSVYFIATRLLRDRGAGPTLIVSPLLALMRNQRLAAERLGVRAESIDSTNTKDWASLQAELLAGRIDVLLVSPERLANDAFVEKTLLPVASRIGLLVVDEAHCISDWGHDFRPDYRRLVRVLQHLPPNLPVLGTTATANDRVIQDATAQLGGLAVQRGPLVRETLALQTVRLPDQAARLAWLATHLPRLEGSGIVYVLTKLDAERVASWLTQRGIEARAYYSTVEAPGFADSNAYRAHLEELLLGNRVKALVATVALGMGFDKPDLGFVVHYQAPGSIISYYQQVGRAGRAIPRAVGLLLSGAEDEQIHDFFRRKAFPSEKQVLAILAALESTDGLTARELEATVNLSYGQLGQALKFLSVEDPAPVMMSEKKWRRVPVPYSLDHTRLDHLTRQREAEWAEVQRYLGASDCLMMFLARALDDATAEPCGSCAACLGRPVVAPTYDRSLALEAVRFLKRSDFPLVCKRQVAANAFVEYGFCGNLPPELHAEEGRVLCRWRDAGWGEAVANGKARDHFDDELVDATAEMITTRWKPCPEPLWLTCVPSHRHPELVPDFARRLATRLGLPFVNAVRKVRDNAPQKEQQNRFQQCRNLDGVFEIADGIPTGPVLLVDDIVDSAWTLTVIAALLRRAGSGPVLPVALASTSTGD